jgi:membrane dipeptidase
MMTLTWTAKTSWKRQPDSHGLTGFGRAAIPALKTGIVVDVSHLNDAGFWRLRSLAKRPLCASLSNSARCAGIPQSVPTTSSVSAEHRGLVGLNYYVVF